MATNNSSPRMIIMMRIMMTRMVIMIKIMMIIMMLSMMMIHGELSGTTHNTPFGRNASFTQIPKKLIAHLSA